MFRKMPFILALAIVIIIVCDPFISLPVKSALYAMSLLIKSGILFVLPFVIFGLLFKASLSLASKATTFIGLLLVGICSSNFLSTMVSRFAGLLVYQSDLSLSIPSSIKGLEPLFDLQLPSLVTNEKAMFAGLFLGILFSYIKPIFADGLLRILENVVDNLLIGITYVVPVFIIGFVVKLYHDGLVGMIVRDYSLIFAFIALVLFLYITSLYFIANRFDIKKTAKSLQNMVPAALTGLGSMSSAAAMPLTIVATKNNCEDPNIARSIIPATVNIHLIGDCFAIPIFAYAIMKSYGVMAPTFGKYLIFACYFVLAKFSVAAIPGGGIIVMLPILKTYLGFTAEMLSLITALYVLFDPVITCANIFGNGGFAIFFDKIVMRNK